MNKISFVRSSPLKWEKSKHWSKTGEELSFHWFKMVFLPDWLKKSEWTVFHWKRWNRIWEVPLVEVSWTDLSWALICKTLDFELFVTTCRVQLNCNNSHPTTSPLHMLCVQIPTKDETTQEHSSFLGPAP